MVNTLAKALGLNFENPLTPDLMPSDILGSEILDENRQFKFIKGPVFRILFWQMKSTEHHKKHRPLCSKRCKNGPLPLQVKIISWTALFCFGNSKPYYRGLSFA
jgi:hypothetical protein